MRSIAQKLLRRFTASRPLQWMRSAFADQRGNVLILTALTMPALLAMSGLAFEGASWYQTKRAMQNAADTAAVAAATNNGASYISEARAVTAQYGFQNGVDNTTVTVSNTVTCPVSGSTCYSVSITKSLPLYFTKLIGYSGNVVISGSPGQQIASIAVAVEGTAPREYCILALATSVGASEGIRTNGAPTSDLNGCSVMSNTNAKCNGHNLNATYGDAHGTSNGCGTKQTSNLPVVSDPYSGLASNIPANNCNNYQTTQISGSYSWTGNTPFCGSVQLTGDVTLTGSNVAIIIYNGNLDTNGYTIRTATGASATIIFSGDNTSAAHAPINGSSNGNGNGGNGNGNGNGGNSNSGGGGSGTIDITAPTTGSWKGIALYQNPNLTNGVDISEAGNKPAWNITGLVYLPHSSVTFSGIVNKSSNGAACFALVVDNITINGTGKILAGAQGSCASAGLTLPTGQISSRGRLVS
jgi:Flp pilus assembly protein TadG